MINIWGYFFLSFFKKGAGNKWLLSFVQSDFIQPWHSLCLSRDTSSQIETVEPDKLSRSYWEFEMSKKILVCLPDLWLGFTSGKLLYLSQESESRLLTHCGCMNIPHEANSQRFPVGKSCHLMAWDVSNKDCYNKVSSQDWNRAQHKTCRTKI